MFGNLTAYENLYAILELYIEDKNKIGIFGHSGGGFMSTAAMLVYPDFFKVAVSSAGNHDNSIYNSWWSESHHGIEKKESQDGKIEYVYDIDICKICKYIS